MCGLEIYEHYLQCDKCNFSFPFGAKPLSVDKFLEKLTEVKTKHLK